MGNKLVFIDSTVETGMVSTRHAPDTTLDPVGSLSTQLGDRVFRCEKKSLSKQHGWDAGGDLRLHLNKGWRVDLNPVTFFVKF